MRLARGRRERPAPVPTAGSVADDPSSLRLDCDRTTFHAGRHIGYGMMLYGSMANATLTGFVSEPSARLCHHGAVPWYRAMATNLVDTLVHHGGSLP